MTGRNEPRTSRLPRRWPRRTPSGATVSLTIDGRQVAAPAGTTVLEAAHDAGIEVPHLCDDPRLAPAEVCRLCVVELDGAPEPVPSCGTPVREGMVVRTRSDALRRKRHGTLELLARRYPAEAARADPDVPLHRYFAEYGVVPSGGRRVPIDDGHPYIRVDLSRCIECLRCVRICEEVQGQFVWKVWDRGEDARVVAGSGAGLLDSDCVSCGACADTCPTGALADRSVVAHGAPERFTRTTCPYCGTGCELSAGTRAGRLVQVLPVMDSKVSHGHLCVKGRYAFEFVHAEDRLTRPLLRDGSGFREATWDEATAHVARELARIRDTHGPDSIGLLSSARGTNEESYVVQKLARVALGTNNVDCCARVCHAPTATAMARALGTGAATNSFDDVERTRCILICGANPTEGHPVVGARIKQAVLDGAALIVVDPRRTELAALATVHLAVRPGGNVPLLNAMAHVIVAEGLEDRAFLRDHAREVEAYREFIATFTPESVAGATGVDPDAIRTAARLYATRAPAMQFHGLGTTEHTQGTDGVSCLVNLALLTGNLGKAGAGVNPLRGQNNVQGAAHMGCEPGHVTGYATLDAAREPFARAWGTALPPSPGLDLVSMLEAAREGRLKALWTIGYDVLHTNPDFSETERALAALELVVVSDPFLNETARRHAHVVLPSCSAFEKDGTFMNSERRVQRVRRVVEPVGESRSDLEAVCDVARHLGHGAAFAFADAEAAWEEIRTVWPAGRGITYGRLDREGGLQWPCPGTDHPGTTVLHGGKLQGGAAALARIPYVPTEERTSPDYPLLMTTGRTLHQFNSGTMTHRTSGKLFRPEDVLDLSPADAARLGVAPGDRVTIQSRHGAARLPIEIDDGLREGECFATFHAEATHLNRVTGPHVDRATRTPEYKVVAVRVERT